MNRPIHGPLAASTRFIPGVFRKFGNAEVDTKNTIFKKIWWLGPTKMLRAQKNLQFLPTASNIQQYNFGNESLEGITMIYNYK